MVHATLGLVRNYLLSFNIYFKKSIKVTQSLRVPRVRGGDPSGVAPGKVEDNNSGPGHPRKLISWKLGRCIHHLCMGGLSASSDVWKMSRIIYLSMILYFIPLRDFLIRLDSEIFFFPSCFLQLHLPKSVKRFFINHISCKFHNRSRRWPILDIFLTFQEDKLSLI